MIYLASPYSHPDPAVRELRVRDEVIVLMLDGWRESVGVQAEIRIAGECGKPVRYVAPEGVGHEKTPAEAGVEGGVR